MRISPDRQFMLFHVPRTGGSSVIAALDESLFVRAAPTRLNKLMSKCLPFIRRPVSKTYMRPHETARRVRLLLPAEFSRFHKISFVRNPYSWLVSLYELVAQRPGHRHHARINAMRGFSDYVDWEIGRRKRMQFPYLCDKNGELIVDEIGRFEHLAEDAARIFDGIGVPIAALPVKGQLTRRDYREFYDDATRRKVASHWADDLALFGYDFDGPV